MGSSSFRGLRRMATGSSRGSFWLSRRAPETTYDAMLVGGFSNIYAGQVADPHIFLD
jgi:hypothetical protein